RTRVLFPPILSRSAARNRCIKNEDSDVPFTPARFPPSLRRQSVSDFQGFMYEHEYEAMYLLETSYWWYVARRTLAVELLEEEIGGRSSLRILDVGCGTGANVNAFASLADTVGIDDSIEALRFCHERGIQSVSLSHVEELPFACGAFDIVTALDILEHTDDD